MICLSIDEKWALMPSALYRRVAEVPWLIRPLVHTSLSRQRLLTWFEAGGLDRAALSAEQVRDRVAYFGDPEMLDAVVAALTKMAPPARDFILEHTTIVGTAWSTNGWAAGGSIAQSHRDRVIVLSGTSRDSAVVSRLMLHEGAHLWLEGLENTGTPVDKEKFVEEAKGMKSEGLTVLSRIKAILNECEEYTELLAANWNIDRESFLTRRIPDEVESASPIPQRDCRRARRRKRSGGAHRARASRPCQR